MQGGLWCSAPFETDFTWQQLPISSNRRIHMLMPGELPSTYSSICLKEIWKSTNGHYTDSVWRLKIYFSALFMEGENKALSGFTSQLYGCHLVKTFKDNIMTTWPFVVRRLGLHPWVKWDILTGKLSWAVSRAVVVTTAMTAFLSPSLSPHVCVSLN